MDVVAQLSAALADRYVVEREIGRGGMATVYLARDLKHARLVALKVLDPELGAVLGVERFLSEIRVTANLQHPNLLPLFDSGESNGLLFYVMPFIEGESLRHRLDREKQLPVDETVRIGGAIAGALDYAHRHGVIHRDLKPENILLHDGQPLIADFGIALALSNAAAGRITQTGLSLGTPQYMSPEQAAGDRVIDGRTDLYSLGAVLYEMLTGDPPHSATTAQAVIAKLLTERPRSVRAGRPAVPAQVAAAVEHALEKLPADRFATGQQMADALAGRGPSLIIETVAAHAAEPRNRWTRLGRTAPWIVAASALGIAAWALSTRAPAARPIVVALQTPDSVAPRIRFGRGRMLAISSDGNQIAWVGGVEDRTGLNGATRLYLRTLADPAPRPIPGTEGATCPAFSPDGAWLLFVLRADRRLHKVQIAGGSPIPVADSATSCGSWGDHGTIVFERRGALWRVPALGGTATRIAAPDSAGTDRLSNPVILPGEQYAIVTHISAQRRELVRVALSDGRVEPLGISGMDGRYSRTGHLLYVTQDGSLMAVGMSASGRVSGAPALIAPNVALQPGASGQFAVSDEGTLISLFGAAVPPRRVVEVDTSGRALPVGGEERSFGWVRISPDGNRAAFEIGERGGASWGEWILDLHSSALSRLTAGDRGIRTAGWSADGRKVVFLAPLIGRDENSLAASKAVVAMPWDRSAPPETLIAARPDLQQAAVGPAHGYAALALGPTVGQMHLVLAPLDTPGVARTITPSTSGLESEPRLSADGRWLAFDSDESGRGEVYAIGTAGRGRVQISVNGGESPVWDPKRFAVFYRGPRRIMRATLAAAPELRVVKRDSLFEDSFWRSSYAYDVFPDGKRFLMLSAESSQSQMTLYLNWPALLAGRKPRG